MKSSKVFIFVIAAAVILRLAFAIFRPNWQAPDEFPHFYYSSYLALENDLPDFNAQYPYYESYQPPLYYFMSAILLKMAFHTTGRFTDTIESLEVNGGFFPEMIFVRLFSVILGVLAIVLSWSIFKETFTTNREHAKLAFLLLLFHPTFLSNTTSITNDALAVCIGFLLLYFILDNSVLRRPFVVGITLAAGVLTKANMLLFIPVFIGVLAVAGRKDTGKILPAFAKLLTPLILVPLISLLFFDLQTVKTWLFPPYSGTPEEISVFRVYQIFRNFFWSFWAAFGRIYEIHLPSLLYVILFFPVCVISLHGLARTVFKREERPVESFYFNTYLLITGIFVVSSFFFSILFISGTNTSWGKNIFPILPAVLFLFVFGLYKSIGNRAKIIILLIVLVCLLTDLWAISIHTGLL
ncbi:glycosyltransferase family 39 protein [candidate division KSB1 bacterium]